MSTNSIQNQPPKRPLSAPAAPAAAVAKPAAAPSDQAKLAPAPAAQAKASLAPHTAADAFKPLLQSLAGQLQKASPLASLFHIRQTAALANAAPVAAAPPSPQLQAFQGTTAYKGLNAGQQKQAVDVFNATNINGQRDLTTLANRTVGTPPHSALLDVDSKGATLLDNLAKLASTPIDDRFAKGGITRESLLASTIQEAGQPGQINQSDHGTCTVTSMQYMLCEHNPAEYTRLIQGLMGPSGEVKLRNGDTLKRVDDSIANDSAWDRSPTERVFQAAMMDYSNGFLNYSNIQDKNNLLPGIGMGGLIDPQVQKGLEGLFGKDFKRVPPYWKAFWGQQDIVDSLSKQGNANAIILMGWGHKNFLGIPEGGHALVATRVENDRVYFRNPWGPTGDPVGTNYQEPPRRLENPAIREESMSVADFKKWVWSAFTP